MKRPEPPPESECEARQLVAELEVVMQHVPLGIMFVDRASGCLLRANARAMDILGQHFPENADFREYELSYSVEHEDGSPYPLSELPIRKALATGRQQHADDLFVRRADHSLVRLEVWAIPLSRSGGEGFDAVAAMFRELTGCRVADARGGSQPDPRELEALFQAQKMRSAARLAGGVAHDFNNILVSVLGNASILQAQLSPDHEWYAPVCAIVEGAEKAAEITKQLLTYSRGGSCSPRPDSLCRVVEEALPLCRSAISKKVKIEFEARTPHDRCTINTPQMQQVLLDLCLNAEEAMPNGGTIHIWLEAAPGPHDSPLVDQPCVCLHVKDEGGGIDGDLTNKIFEPFFTTKEFGRGMGLASVRDMLRKHQADIRLHSPPGNGADFQMYFLLCTES